MHKSLLAKSKWKILIANRSDWVEWEWGSMVGGRGGLWKWIVSQNRVFFLLAIFQMKKKISFV